MDLSFTKFEGFYNKDQSRPFYGIEISGLTEKDLDNADLGDLPAVGRRSPRGIKTATVEATYHGGPNVAFDVDLYNAKTIFGDHPKEVAFNKANKTSTHPADVARLLFR